MQTSRNILNIILDGSILVFSFSIKIIEIILFDRHLLFYILKYLIIIASPIMLVNIYQLILYNIITYF
jgi:hypothetical protein